MVSKASDDFPDPLTPVTMTSLPDGSVTSMFLRLCVRAPLTTSGPRVGLLDGSGFEGVCFEGVGTGSYFRETVRKQCYYSALPRAASRGEPDPGRFAP